jgi:hypothetical protein
LDNIVICTNFSEDCSGDISAGESLSCTIDNVVIDTSPATLTVNKTIFGSDTTNSLSMNCRSLLSTSSLWISCNDSHISNTIFCRALNENSFDIEVNASNNQQINQFEGSAAGINITNLQPGTYRVNEIKHPNNINQLGEDPLTEAFCVQRRFSDGIICVVCSSRIDDIVTSTIFFVLRITTGRGEIYISTGRRTIEDKLVRSIDV